MTDAYAKPATRDAGLAALQRFLPGAGRQYARSRNFDYGPERRDNVSMLSPFVRHRLVLEEDLLRGVIRAHGFGEAQKYIEEVYWRTYFKGWLEHHPDVWTNYLEELAELVAELESNCEKRERYNQAIAGQTGIDCFDAWTQELAETGYLHNHARMWFASIWVYTLDLPWQLGADFFLRHLLDGDPASNTLGWRWVCGLHTRGKTYLARVSNIANFTNYRFNPRGLLATEAPPRSEDAVVRRVVVPAADAMPDSDFGLLVTEDDASPERALVTRAPVAALGLTATNDRSVLPVTPLVYDFASDAVDDALDRVREHFACPVEAGGDRDWGETVRAWCERHSLSAVLTPWVPVGPARSRLDALEATLGGDGICLYRVRRQYDEDAWPFAGRGYFKLKRQIPELVERLGLETALLKTG